MNRPLAITCAALAPGIADAQPVRPYRPAVDVVAYDFALTIPDTGSTIDGVATVRFVRATPTDTLVLDLRELRVADVRVNGQPARFVRDAATVRIALPRPAPSRVARADTLTAVVRYGGAPRDGLVLSRDDAGHVQAFGDNWPDRARHWLPTVDHPSDKATVTWTVTAPRTRTVVANGALVDERDAPAPAGSPAGTPWRVTRWRETRPIAPYMMVVAVAPLVRVPLGATACGLAEDAGCVRQDVYVAPGVRGFAPGPFAAAGEIVRWMSALVAPFPYEKLAHVESTTRFGGMENASAIFYADAAFLRGTLDRDLIAHETAHQWFGDAVTEREWSHLWLSEGFATYWAALDLRRASGDSAFRVKMAQLRTKIAASTVTAERPVLDTAETDYTKLLNTNSYEKGAWTLHMLRGMLGDSAFFRGVRAYYVAHRHSTAVTDDLRLALERSSGRPLAWFFDQWLRRPGIPALTIRWMQDPASQRVTMIVAQDTRRPPFRVPLTIAITDALGRRTTTRLEIPALATTTVEIAATGTVAELVVDPGVELLATVGWAP